jgi:hypothetical protein
MLWLLAPAIMAATLCPIRFRPTVGLADLERGLTFMLLGGLISITYPKHRVICFLLAIGAAALLEAGQGLAQDRHGLLHDFDVKALAVVAGILIGACILPLLLSRMKKR